MIKKLSIIFALILTITSCSLERRIAREIKKHPEHAHIVTKDTVITPPAVDDSSCVEIVVEAQDTIETILEAHHIDSVEAKIIAVEVNKAVQKKARVKDTTFTSSDGVLTSIKSNGGKISISNKRESKPITVHQQETFVTVSDQSSLEKIATKLGLLFLLLLVLYVLYRLAKLKLK